MIEGMGEEITVNKISKQNENNNTVDDKNTNKIEQNNITNSTVN